MRWTVGPVEGRAKNAPQGRARIARRFIAGNKSTSRLPLLLAGEAREQEEGDGGGRLIPSDKSLGYSRAPLRG